jgi:sulfoxide reductase catalytic subunit YedY
MASTWNRLNSRRSFFKTLGSFLMKFLAVAGLLMIGARSAAAFFKKRLLPAGTDPGRLYNEDPEYLDIRNLEVMPVESFDIMGDNQVVVDMDKWRLEVAGEVRKPLQLSYPEVLKLPSVKKKALLVCAGLFSYHAEYTGISLATILEMGGAAKDASRVAFRGQGEFLVGKKERFRIEEIAGDKLFLAYAVNGQPLPRQHGFPLRLVAEEHYGERWVKYVYKVEIY